MIIVNFSDNVVYIKDKAITKGINQVDIAKEDMPLLESYKDFLGTGEEALAHYTAIENYLALPIFLRKDASNNTLMQVCVSTLNQIKGLDAMIKGVAKTKANAGALALEFNSDLIELRQKQKALENRLDKVIDSIEYEPLSEAILSLEAESFKECKCDKFNFEVTRVIQRMHERISKTKKQIIEYDLFVYDLD